MENFFSVIIPAYNAENYISRCIRSILNQTFKYFEILCIDDGSTDRTSEIIDEYAEKDSRVNVFHLKNSGIANARNVGLEHANGKYIYCVDADDWIEETLFEQIYTKYLDESIDIIIIDYYLEKEKKKIHVNSNAYLKEGTLQNIRNYESLSRYFFGGKRVVWNKFVRKSLIKNNQIKFKELFHVEDVLYCLEIYSYAKKIDYFHMAGYHYFQGDTGISRRYIGENVVWMHKNLYLEQEKIKSNFENMDYERLINTYLINSLMTIVERFIYNSQNRMSSREKKSYLEKLIYEYPFNKAFEYYDRKYLGYSAKLFMNDNRPDLFIIKCIFQIKKILNMK